MSDENKAAENEELLSTEEEEAPVTVVIDYDEDAQEEKDYSSHSALTGVVTAKEDIKEEPKYEKPKLKGKEAWENFIYHNKTYLIIALVLIVVLVVGTVLSLPKPRDQLVMIYANENIGEDGLAKMGKELEKYCEDVNGDGKVNVEVLMYNMNSTDMNVAMSAVYAIETDLSADYASFIMITDRGHLEFIRQCWENDVYVQRDGYPDGIPTSWSKLLTGTQEEDDDSLVYVQLLRLPEKEADDEKKVAAYESAAAVIDKMIEAGIETSDVD